MAITNAIEYVGSVHWTPDTVHNLKHKQPSKMVYGLQDISSPDAGRDESGYMHKMQITQKVTLDLSWNGLTSQEVSEILQAFNHEYLNITFLSPYTGDAQTKNFYVGDRSSPCYNAANGLWESVSFKVIER